jgi:hypothetical protein
MKCPHCGDEVRYLGIVRNPRTGANQTGYASSCGRTYIKNESGVAVPKPVLDKAVRLYEEFNMKPADKVMMANISLPDKETNPLVHLGKIAGIIYISDKEGKKGQRYIHDTDPPHPDFFCTVDGKTFIIAGGNMRISAGWLYY